MNNKKYILLRLSILLKGILPSLLSFFIYRKRFRVIFSSEFNTEFNHNSKWLFLYFLEECKSYEVKFVINDATRRQELIEYYGPYFISNTKFHYIIYILSSYTWFTSSLETPIGGFFHSFRRKVFHLGHGIPIKSIGLQERNLSITKVIYYSLIRSNFSYFVSTSPVFDKVWESFIDVPEKKVIRGGQPRNDCFFLNDTHGYNCDNSVMNILYAPTWRPYSETKLFPFSDFSAIELDDFLGEVNAFIYLRLHPNFEENIPSNLLCLKNVRILKKSQLSDINEFLSRVDLLITDYSSIYADFLLLNKPIMFLPYDYDIYERLVGFSVEYKLVTPGPKPKSFKDFKVEAKKLLSDIDYYSEERIRICKLFNVIQKEHSKSILKLL